MATTVTQAVMIMTIAAGLSTAAIGARAGVAQQAAAATSLANALVFHAGFDGGVGARVACGEPALFCAPTWNRRQEAQSGLRPSGDTRPAARPAFVDMQTTVAWAIARAF